MALKSFKTEMMAANRQQPGLVEVSRLFDPA
jgi:hypothetical protein